MTPTSDRVRSMRRDLADHRRALAAIDRLIPPAIIALDTRNDGWPTGTGSGNGISDPVGSQIAQISDLLELDSQLRLQWAVLTEIADTITAKLEAMASSAPVEAVQAASCGAGLQIPGYESWGRRNAQGALTRCDDLVHADGLCTGCYHRRRRWTLNQRRGAA